MSAFEWHKWFKEGREEVENDQRSGRPSSRTADNTEQVKQLVRTDHRLTVRMIASELSISKETVWRIITEDLGMRKSCAKMIPKLLSDDQKERRVLVCKNILERLETEPSKSLLEMRVGSLSMIQKRSDKAFNGKVPDHQGPRKRRCRSQRWS